MTDEQRAQEILEILSEARWYLQRAATLAMPKNARTLVLSSIAAANEAVNRILHDISEQAE